MCAMFNIDQYLLSHLAWRNSCLCMCLAWFCSQPWWHL